MFILSFFSLCRKKNQDGFFKSECTLVNDVRTYSVGVVFQYDAPYISVKAAISVCIYTTRHRIMDCSIEHAFMNYTIKPGFVPMSGKIKDGSFRHRHLSSANRIGLFYLPFT